MPLSTRRISNRALYVWMSRLAGSGLSTYNKIAADDVKIAKAETFKIFVDNTEWDNFIVSFKDLPGYPNYSTALIAYKTVSLALFAGLGISCMALIDGNVIECQAMRVALYASYWCMSPAHNFSGKLLVLVTSLLQS